MTLWKSLVLPLACALSLGVVGCGGESPGGGKSTSGSTSTSGSKSASGGKPSGGPADPHVAKFRIGHALGQDGEVVDEGRTFSKGTKVYVSFTIEDAQPQAQARVSWVTKPTGTQLAEETKPLPDGAGVVSFATDTASWKPGTYMVETWVLESGVNSVRKLGAADFSIGDSQSK